MGFKVGAKPASLPSSVAGGGSSKILVFPPIEHDDEQSTTCLYSRLSTANNAHTILAWASSTLDIVVLGIFLGRCFCICHEECWRATRSARRANVPRQQRQQGRGPTLLSLTSKNENENSDETDKTKSAEDDKMLSELVRVKLEADHKRKVLKSRPRKLKCDEARTWVQRNLGVDTEDEFNDLVESGNLRTPYIPKRPEECCAPSQTIGSVGITF